ncbi:acetylglutamate kinase [Caldalkalibacillus uzonensis]|uniref:Acetylglutamate kinase n=1 Tax=Caldalkalibacillus uzonensis TaxID=353224 RepID=A0ABU0CWA4_9BACI|nr:acetylglutamate kinase [Caldalkalibacillus uzonensis]MDQ0340704.1 acetylglutamate kinase [Caldalkalibacillus uzonensis]
MQYVVIKCGGSVFETLPDSFFKQIANLQKGGSWRPVIVHGGGPAISSLLKVLNIPSSFVNGLRVTTPKVLNTVEMVLSGKLNKQVVRKLKQAGAAAIGLSGVDGDLLEAEPVAEHKKLGLVGQIKQVNADLLHSLMEQGLIPVISPISIDQQGQHYNVNADIAAAAVAATLKAALCFVSDIPGIYVGEGEGSHVLETATKAQLEQLIEEQVITGGMVPKVQAALSALSQHVPEVVILNGKDERALLDFCQGQSVGTKIVMEGAVVHG